MPQTVLYGGTFNPIHLGHLDVCIRAREAVDAEKVLLIPAAQPPHKSTGWLAPDRDRLALCDLACQDHPFIRTEDWELRQGGHSYTVDTLRYLTGAFLEEKFWLLMGADMFLTFTQWKDWEEIGEMASLLVASREDGEEADLRAQKKRLEERGIRIKLLNNPPMPMSSSEIREELRRTRSSESIAPQVLDYIRENALYPENPEDPDFLRRYIRPLMTDYRYNHSLGVERQAVYLAKLYGADEHKAAVAGILHDVCKDMPKGPLLQNVLESGIMNGIDFRTSPQLIHSYAGALYLQSHMDIHDPEIIGAVRYHTSARAGMTLLETVIYLADLTSEDRTYSDIEVMRRLCREDKREAMAYALRYIVEELARKGRQICPDTLRACEEYGVPWEELTGKDRELCPNVEKGV